MKRLLASLFAVSLLCVGGALSADDGGGFVLDGRGTENVAVTLSVPASAFRGDVVTVSVSYPSVNPTNLRCLLLLPTNDPATYEQEVKAYLRQSKLSTTGASCPFYIPTFDQIEGTAVAVAIVDGEGSDFATFEIFP